MDSFQMFSFGDFTEEEHNNFLKQPTCVEFPGSWDLDFMHPDVTHIPPDGEWQPLNQKSTIDENQNHMPNSKDWVKVSTYQGLQGKESGEYPPLGNHGNPSPATAEQRTPLSNTGAAYGAAPLATDSNSIAKFKMELANLEDSKENNFDGPMVNGHGQDQTGNSVSNSSDVIDRVPKDNEKSSDIDQIKIEGAISASSSIESTQEDSQSSKLDRESRAEDVPTDKVIDSNTEAPPSKPADKPANSWASLFSANPSAPKAGRPVPFAAEGKTASVPAHGNQGKNAPSKKKSVTFNGLPPKPVIKTSVVDVMDDLFSKHIAEQIRKNEIVYRSPGLMPRGFVNSSNWCYINATLQALLTCSPFCHLMRSFPSRPPPVDNNIATSTPILDSFVRLVKELKPLPKKNIQRNAKEQWYGNPHEPDYIYKMLSIIKSNLSERGRQEDAEEFLSCVLNGLHEEMLKLNEYYNGKLPAKQSQKDDATLNSPQTELGYEIPVHDEEQNSSNEEQEEQWEEVQATRKNRSSVMRRADISKTPVSEVFRGELRSDLFQDGHKGTATLEPFFTLPLDINDYSTWSVNEALEHLTRLEPVHDFTNSKTKAKVEATRRQTLHTLPPVLVLHLKRFVYDKTGGSLKLDKEIQYHTDLLIGKELLSKSAKKLSQDKRSYKLFAVVYHHGKNSTGGHYTTDVYHDGLSCWLRIDDHSIKVTNVHEVVKHNTQRTAYLLYYKRTDLMTV